MARKKNKSFLIISAEEMAEIERKAARSAHHEMMQNCSVRGGAQGKQKYSRKEKHKKVYC